MSDYQPKVGDRVMVGEHGPYKVDAIGVGYSVRMMVTGFSTWVPAAWLTPAPEPEPDEPTAPGALVRDGQGRLLARDHDNEWLLLAGPSAIAGDWFEWSSLPRPITVVLADPAEVDTLRAEVESSGREVKAAWDRARRFKIERDEFDRTIDRALNELTRAGGTVHRAVTILRGES